MSDKKPTKLSILPLSNKVLFPGLAMRLHVSNKEKDVLVDKLIKQLEEGQKPYLCCLPIPIPITQKGEYSEVMIKYKEIIDTVVCVGRLISLKKSTLFESGYFFMLEGVSRAHVRSIDGNSQMAFVEYINEKTINQLNNKELELYNKLVNNAQELIFILESLKLPDSLVFQLKDMIKNAAPSSLADLIINVVEIDFHEKLNILGSLDLQYRLSKTLDVLSKHIEILKISKPTIKTLKNTSDPFKKITNNSTDLSEDEDDLGELAKRYKNLTLSEEANKIFNKELKRLKKMSPSMADYQVLRTYLDWLLDLPWNKNTDEIIDIVKSKRILNNDHFGLEKVKKRILEYLAVCKLRKDMRGPILCLSGPPGVGKTSLGKSIANALGRKFYRISLGGVRDEAEIRGHRRTYVGAMPGLIIQALKKCGVNNPVILLDEIDKMTSEEHHGDPAAAMLEVLDPEQNSTFVDHYINTPFDLSKVLFIATANRIDSITAPLLDRMELIQLSGYTIFEKLSISEKYLLPKQIDANGLALDDIKIDQSVLSHIIVNYTHESGVRSLEREIASVCRFKAVELLNSKENDEQFNKIITIKDLEKILGVIICA